MSLQKAKPANTIYQVIPPRSKLTTAGTNAETVAGGGND